MSSRKRRCATCRYFQTSNLAGNGWCTHPQRQVSTDVRILVRKNELACRDSWGRDLWASADEGAIEDDPDDTAAPPIPSPEDLTIPIEQLDDQVTSVVSSFPDQPNDTPYTDDIIVEQTSYVYDEDDSWGSDNADEPDDETEGDDDADDNAKALASARDQPEDINELNRGYLEDQQERARVIARGNKDAILRARERHRQMRRPSRPQVTAASESNAGEHPETPADTAEPQVDAPFEEEVVTTHPPTFASPSPDSEAEGDSRELADGPSAYPAYRSARRTTYRTFGSRPASASEPFTTPAWEQGEDNAAPAIHPERSDADRFDTVPEIRSDVDLPLLRKRLHVPGYTSRADHEVEGAETDASPTYNRVLERAREIRAANQTHKDERTTHPPRVIESATPPIEWQPEPEPDPEPAPESEPVSDIEHGAPMDERHEPEVAAEHPSLLPLGAFDDMTAPDPEPLAEPDVPTWSHELSRVVNHDVRFRRATPSPAPADEPEAVSVHDDQNHEPVASGQDLGMESAAVGVEQEWYPSGPPRRSFWRSFNFGLRNLRAARSAPPPPEDDAVEYEDELPQSPPYWDTPEDEADYFETFVAAQEPADPLDEEPALVGMVDHDVPEPVVYAPEAHPPHEESEPVRPPSTTEPASITIEDDADAWYGDDIATTSQHSRYFGYTPTPDDSEAVPEASLPQEAQTATVTEPEPEPFRTAFWDNGGFNLSDRDEMDAFRSRLFGQLQANHAAPEEPEDAPRPDAAEPTRLYARDVAEGGPERARATEDASAGHPQPAQSAQHTEDRQRFDIRQFLTTDDEDHEQGTPVELAPHLSRSCQTCRDFRPSGDGARGWCNNAWAFTHRQMVNATDLPCQSSIGCWWLPADDYLLDHGDLASEKDRAPRVDRLLAQRYSDERAAER